jgi:hypothetical protein
MRRQRFSWSWRGTTKRSSGRWPGLRDELRVRSACEGKTVLVQPRGVANKITESELCAALDTAVESEPDLVVLDVSGLLACDEGCRDSLVRINTKAARKGVNLVAPGASHLLTR